MHVFVYGTLKRGGPLHRHLQAQQFVGVGRTSTLCRLYDLGWYPGLIADSNGLAIDGEVWDVDDMALNVLDKIESVADGLYERRHIQLQPPFENRDVSTYFYLGDVAGHPDCGPCWPIGPALNEVTEPDLD